MYAHSFWINTGVKYAKCLNLEILLKLMHFIVKTVKIDRNCPSSNFIRHVCFLI